ncbi:MAG: tetratricopeptide repeat protein [Desulfobacula sp.]|nr:tetratricopeptide repeat protein [Desulfobacula sp.]MCK5348304.1 tetratricopeptide repeat protein [Desulfobacula sp.]
MKIRVRLCHTTWLFILPLTLMIAATAMAQASQANERIAYAKSLDQKAESIIKRGRLLQSIDALNEDEADKICNFAIEYEQAEWIKTRVYKTPFHDDIALTLQNISSLYNLCHPPLSQKYLSSILKIKEKLYSKESEQAASAHDALGDYYRLYMMNFKKAINQYEEAKRIRKKLYGVKDPRAAKNNNLLALTLFYHKGEKSEAKQLLHDAITIRENLPANKAYPVHQAYMDAGIYYSMVGEYDSAIVHFKKALNTLNDLLNDDYITILSELAVIYLNKDDLKISHGYIKEAYEKAKVLYERNHAPDFLQIIDLLSDICMQMGDIKTAKQLRIEHKKVKDQLIKGV